MADVQVPEQAYDAADRYLATKAEGEDSLGAVDAAAPFIAQAAREDERRKYAEAVTILRELYVEYDNHPAPDPLHRRTLWDRAGQLLAKLDEECQAVAAALPPLYRLLMVTEWLDAPRRGIGNGGRERRGAARSRPGPGRRAVAGETQAIDQNRGAPTPTAGRPITLRPKEPEEALPQDERVSEHQALGES